MSLFPAFLANSITFLEIIFFNRRLFNAQASGYRINTGFLNHGNHLFLMPRLWSRDKHPVQAPVHALAHHMGQGWTRTPPPLPRRRSAAGSPMTMPHKAAATPVVAFKKEISTGMSAPPTCARKTRYRYRMASPIDQEMKKHAATLQKATETRPVIIKYYDHRQIHQDPSGYGEKYHRGLPRSGRTVSHRPPCCR
jgi:hypothetical protein